jgi:MFS family permease
MGPSAADDHRNSHPVENNDDESLTRYHQLLPTEQQIGPNQPSQKVLLNFVIMSILFSANHGAMVSCLAFATLQLGSTGAWELSLFHCIYAASALLGATYICKQLGSRNSMGLGMALYASYVTLFWIAVKFETHVTLFAVMGAVFGGMGGGFVWTAQGSYFSRAAEEYALCCGSQPVQDVTSYLAGIFAFIYLAEEVICKILSWLLLHETGATWSTVLLVYSLIATLSTIMMAIVYDYPVLPSELQTSTWYKVSCAWQLLRVNPKMKYMVGFNAVFGFAYPFVNAYVNGEVVGRVQPSQDPHQGHVGLFSALSATMAAICSLIFARCSSPRNKGSVLILGSGAFLLVALPFVVQPDLTQWTWVMLFWVYCLQGVGRSTFEGALRAVFTDYFPGEKEGSYANIILQNGAFTSLGFLLSFYVPCWNESSLYCVEFKEGGRHNMLVLELAVIVTAILSILGFLRAQSLHDQVQGEGSDEQREPLLARRDSLSEASSLGHDNDTETRLLPCRMEALPPTDNLS